MKIIQQVIKYIALAFSCFLVGTIAICLSTGFNFISNFFDVDQKLTTNILNDLVIEENISNLDLNIKATNIEIKKSLSGRVETNNPYLKITNDQETLYIKEDNDNYFKDNYSVVIYLPNKVMNNLNIKVSAGNIIINNIDITSNLKITSKTGNIKVVNGTINNLEIETNLGNTNISAYLLGTININNKVGNIDLNILDRIDNYTININTNLGQATINNQDLQTNKLGNGACKINLSSVVGNIKINTK